MHVDSAEKTRLAIIAGLHDEKLDLLEQAIGDRRRQIVWEQTPIEQPHIVDPDVVREMLR